ncbi:MAG: DMT family transporter [Silicimonas sp.]|nr:DMT family transporter [Silicimonas sp.]
MSITAFLVVLLGAALHAAWNAIVKGSTDKVMTIVNVAGAAALVAACTLPILPRPDPSSWPFIASSAFFQICYFLLIANVYRATDMGFAYPLMRGVAPLIVTVVSVAALGADVSASAWLGIVVISAGVLSMTLGRFSGDGRALMLALLNAGVIAAYTLIDGEGVRRSGTPAAYTLYLSLLTGPPLVAWALLRHGKRFTGYVALNWHYGLIGGIATVTSYGLALWAMTVAPVAMVSALRETSIVFGAIISVVLLREPLDKRRVFAALTIAAGAASLRL